jgi:Tol biopolymer transport system component
MRRNGTTFPVHWLLVAVVMAAALAAGPVNAEELWSESAEQSAIVDTFYSYRSGAVGSSLAARDLEFHWDAMNDSAITPAVAKTLDNLANTLVYAQSNPLGIPCSALQLVYDYFRVPAYGAGYSLDVADTTSLWFGQGNIAGYNPSDRSHIDIYLINPAKRYRNGLEQSFLPNTTPSGFVSMSEDVSTNHAIGDVKHRNSVHVTIPTGPGRLDTAGTGWTAPGSIVTMDLLHELRHGLHSAVYSHNFGEFFSGGAEVVTGAAIDWRYDVPYAWSLWGSPDSLGGGQTCPLLTHDYSNYLGRPAFGAYLAFNFRGADTTATLAGIEDDLLHKWASDSSATLETLTPLLSDANCHDCAERDYFHPNAVAMSDTLRAALLFHNWRVANFVNSSSLAEGEYGYPPQFGYSPAATYGAWRNNDGLEWDNAISVVPELVMSSQHATRDTVLRDGRTTESCTYPLILKQFGSEYWVIRSDETARVSGQDLVVRVFADSGRVDALTVYNNCSRVYGVSDTRLFVTAVGYSQDPYVAGVAESLWCHPQWATRVYGPQWTDVDTSGSEPVQLVIPSFGDSIKAVVVVLSRPDGPSQYFTEFAVAGPEAVEVEAYHLPYRLQAGLRRAPYASSNPRLLYANAGAIQMGPTFSPDGAKLAFSNYWPDMVYKPMITIRNVDGSGNDFQIGLGAGAIYNRAPDWSPRGDRIAFEGAYTARPYPDIYVINTTTYARTLLTSGTEGADGEPAFSPNGQQIAYTQQLAGSSGLADSTWQIKRIDLSGANDTVLVRSSASRPLRSPRWSPDGLWVYFTAGDSLYAVGVNGASRGDVVDRSSLLDHAPAFDLHRGSGAIAYVEADSVAWYRTSCVDVTQGLPVLGRTKKEHPYRRIALRDTFQTLPVPVFYDRHATYSSPRWSYDGTTLAYVTSENDDGGCPDSCRNIMVAQVSYNHAPQFVNAPRDTTLSVACNQTLTQTCSASDPDGETVTYEGACLPSGATLSAQGQLNWPNPGPLGSTHYVVVRALDGSGGVAQKVIRIIVQPDSISPAAATDVAVGLGRTSAAVTWTDVGDDSLTGEACQVRIAYSVSPITESNFFNCGTFPTQTPAEPGTERCANLTSGLSAGTTYYFALKTQDDAGNWSAISNVASGTTLDGNNHGEVICSDGMALGHTADSPEQVLPAAFALHPAEPNPASSSTRIRFDLPRAANVRLEIFDLQGRRVAQLVSGFLPAGYHVSEWSGATASGRPVGPGVYLCRFAAGDFHGRQKVVVLR